MKVALITYHNADNYGATLQTYATYKIIEELGHEVELIDLRIDEPNSILKKILLYLKHQRFSSFRKKYFKNKTKYFLSLAELQRNPPIADVYIVGSDQTWNSDISKDKARAFFLDFGDRAVKRISYASSFGKKEWEDTQWVSKEDIVVLLNRFKAVSVREASGIAICENTFSIKAIQVLDPVLLHNDYSELTGVLKAQNEIVLYKLVNDPLFYNKVRQLSEFLDIPLRSIGSLRRLSGVRCNYPESLPDWIKAIGESKYVFTDSFHGTVLSLIYKKQFVIFVGNPKLVTRISSLLELVGLEDRICSTSDDLEKIKSIMDELIDYDIVTSRLKSLCITSIDFLKQNI